MGFNKKTVLLALKRVYGKQLIEKYFRINEIKRREEYSGIYDLDYIFRMLKSGKSLNSLIEHKNHNHVKNCLFKVYGKVEITPYTCFEATVRV